jgi:hypothetical protein
MQSVAKTDLSRCFCSTITLYFATRRAPNPLLLNNKIVWQMRSDQLNKLERQSRIGEDKGLRLELRWESGFTVKVHSWEAAAIILKQGLQKRQNSKHAASTFRVNFYNKVYEEGVLVSNPETLNPELCFITLVQNARRGAPRDPEVSKRKAAELKAKIAKLETKLADAKFELDNLT